MRRNGSASVPPPTRGRPSASRHAGTTFRNDDGNERRRRRLNPKPLRTPPHLRRPEQGPTLPHRPIPGRIAPSPSLSPTRRPLPTASLPRRPHRAGEDDGVLDLQDFLREGFLAPDQRTLARGVTLSEHVFIPILPNCKHCQKLGDGESIRHR
nr:uncharacterized protein LOC127340706 isoform X2 [Lolium perenne]